MTDESNDMLARAKCGDKAAFGRLIGENEALVYSAALHFFRNHAWAEDIAQDVFLDLYRSLNTIECVEHLRAWLRRNTMNRCIDRSRKKAYRMEMPASDSLESGREDYQPDFLAFEQIRKQVASLPGEQRAIVILRYQEEMRPAEIADTLSLPVNTVKSRLHRALASLRNRLELRKGQCT